jgi:Zn-dependent M16 (insulinase) family peptidase
VTAQELMGLTTEARQQTRNEVLDVKVSDLQALAEPLSKVLADNYLCVVGGTATDSGC